MPAEKSSRVQMRMNLKLAVRGWLSWAVTWAKVELVQSVTGLLLEPKPPTDTAPSPLGGITSTAPSRASIQTRFTASPSPDQSPGSVDVKR